MPSLIQNVFIFRFQDQDRKIKKEMRVPNEYVGSAIIMNDMTTIPEQLEYFPADISKLPRIKNFIGSNMTATLGTSKKSILTDLPPELYPIALATIQADTSEEYAVNGIDDLYHAYNHIHKLDVTFMHDRVNFRTNIDGAESWVWSLQLIGYGNEDFIASVDAARLVADNKRVEYQRNALTEWYMNGPLGLEQGFTLHEPPSADRSSAILELIYSGNVVVHVSDDQQSLILNNWEHTSALTCDYLTAIDANNHILPVTFSLSNLSSGGQRIRLVVNTQNAAYPITVDPLFQQPVQATSQIVCPEANPTALTWFGSYIAMDGNTLVITAPLVTTGSLTGAFYVFINDSSGWHLQQKVPSPAIRVGLGGPVAIRGDIIAAKVTWNVTTTQDCGLVTGGVGAGADAIYTYIRSNGVWTNDDTLTEPYLSVLTNDAFGTSLAIAFNASTSTYTVIAGNVRGNFYISTRVMGQTGRICNSLNWPWSLPQALSMPSQFPLGAPSYSLALSDSGTIVIGVPSDTSAFSSATTGAIYIQRPNQAWLKLTASQVVINGASFGLSVAISGDTIIVGGGSPNAGYIFAYNNSGWNEEAVLPPPSQLYNGAAVAISGDTAVAGFMGITVSPGMAYVMTRTRSLVTGIGTWTIQQTSSTGSFADNYGAPVAVSGKLIAISASEKNVGGGYGASGGTVYINPSSASGHPYNTGLSSCQFGWAGETLSPWPIGIYSGEKMEQVTDLSLDTPNGQLAFTRTYRQNKQNIYQFMGMGWTHNHAAYLTTPTLAPIQIEMPNGGELRFFVTGTNQFTADYGSDAALTYSSANNQYTITTRDQTQYLFELDVAGGIGYRLHSISSLNNESWYYQYDTSSGGAVPGKLLWVGDNLSTPNRKLVFSYTTGSLPQLQYIGDQTANLAVNPPTGRYVAFSYTPNKTLDSSGNVVSGSGNLLSSVQDVRGNSWSYTYYGQSAIETDMRQLNWLTRQQAPVVDAFGSGIPQTPIITKQLAYNVSSKELIVDGDLEADSSTSWFYSLSGIPQTNQRSTTQIHSGTYSRYVQTNAAQQGIISTQVPMRGSKRYLVTGWVYVVSGSVTMQYSTLQTLNPPPPIFQATSQHTGQWEQLTALYASAHDVPTGGLQFVAATSAATSFYVDTVSFKEITTTGITQQNGNGLIQTQWAFQPGGQNITTETTTNKTITHVFSNGTYAGQLDPAGNSSAQTLNFNYRATAQTDAKGNQTQLGWSSNGSLLNQVIDALGSKTQFMYNNLPGQTGNGTLNTSIDAQGRTTQYSYQDQTNNPRLPTQIKAIDTDGKTVLRWQQFSYDTHGRTLTEKTLDPISGTIEQQTSRSYYSDSLGTPSAGFLQSVTQQDLINPANDSTTTYFYDSVGRTIRTKQSATFGNCIASCSVFDAAGNVVASICNYDAGTNADPTTVAQAVALFNPAFPDKNQVTVYQYDALGRRVQTTTNANASYAQTSLTVYDALNRVVRSIANYVPNQAIPDPYVHARNAFSHGPNNDQNQVTDTAYNERGAVKKQTDVLGNVTLYGYDDAGRLIKTVQYASQPTYDNSYDSNGDPTLSHYAASNTPDQDLVTTSQYDAVGNLVKSTDTLGNVSLTGYDALNRPVQTIVNASQPNYNLTADPTLNHYVPSSAPDQDWLSYTEYDALGRVTRSQDMMGSWTLYGYNGLGQQTKTIRSANQPAYNLAVDPTLSQYAASSAPDQDIISQTVYDSLGRVLYTSDVLGRKTWSAYDGLNRVVRTVTNASGSATDGSAHDPRSSSYSAVQIPDQDLISSTVYDLNGYVMYTVDPLGRKTWTGYDGRGRQIRTVVNALGSATDGGSNDPTSSRYIPNIATDVDVVSQTVYDAQGRVAATIDPQGNRTQFIYDSLGRRTQTVVNFVTGVPNAAVPDQDLINSSVYDIAGRVTTSIDPRGMKTTSTYDRAGRRLTTTQAAGSGQAITSYTCYDKGGRVLRTIQNWVNDPRQPSPDARDANGNWLFNNPFQGNNHDRNLITSYSLDRAGRQVAVIDAIGNQTQMAYAKDGQLISMTDPMGVISTYRYDLLRRRTLTVQNYVTTNRLGVALADPQTWTWNKTSQIWQDGKKTFIHDGNAADPTDQNLIAQVTYDKAGRTLSQRDPKGQVTSYSYNLLNQRTQLIDSSPTPQTWKTDYRLVGNGTTQTKLTDPVGNVVQQTTDRLGRLSLLQYPAESAPKPTPDITFSYDRLGNRLAMSENNGVGTVRRTTYAYDRARRLSAVVLDVHGDGSLLQQVGYQYDPGGLRRQLTLPDGKTVSYQYNTRRQLTNMTDWAGQSTGYGYDGLGRLGAAFRPNGLMSQYSYDAASRLLTLRHSANGHTLASFNYTVDARGNRTQVLESMAGAGTPGTTTLAANDSSINYYRGNWTVNGSLMTSVDSSAALRVPFFGTQATLTMGTGSDHSVFDIYLDGDLWQSGDGYAATTGTQTFSLTLNTDGPHALEVRNRPERNLGNTTQPAVYRLDMSGLSFIGQPAVVRTTVYTYDGVSRLRTADSFAGLNSGGTALQHYAYNYDLDGNRTQAVAPAGTTNFTYDSANHLLTSQLGAGPVVNYTYDHAGRLTNDGTNTYTWDGADRLLSVGSTSYLYNGMGQRMQQTGTSTVTQYVLDTQPGLAKVLQSTTGSNITRYVHGPMGIQEQQNSDATWRHPIQDGLGSVRTVVDTSNTPQESRWYDPYGTEIQQSGSQQTAFGFTGEETDWDGLVNLRARYYNPALGQFMSLDPLEGASCTPMSLNRYMYVQGNIVNQRDPRGLCGQPTNWLDPFDANCYYSADGLARRFSNGDQSRYNSLFSILIQLPWGDLKDIEATGTLASIAMGARRTLDNASIIPGLAQQNFGATVQAFMQYITCPSNSPDQRTLGLLGLGITAYGRLTQIVGEFISKNLNIFAIASVGARVLSGSVGVAPSTLGTVSAAGTTGVVSAFAGSIAGGVSTGYGFASVWDSIRNAADNILYGPSVTQFAWQAGEKRKVVDSSQQPHNCTPPVESEWEDTIHTACDMPEMLYSCDGVIDRNLIPEIMANIELCLTYRKNFAEKCFDNTYDPGHDKEMADRENAWKNCQRKLRYLQNK